MPPTTPTPTPTPTPNPDQVRGEDASDAVLAARKGEVGGADPNPNLHPTPNPNPNLNPNPNSKPAPNPNPNPHQAGGADAVRVLTDGCAHLHLRRPLPMRGVRILPLELSTWSGEHVWPDELR